MDTWEKINDAIATYCFAVWIAVPAIWFPIAIMAIWFPDVLSYVPIDKIGWTHVVCIITTFLAALLPD